MFKHTLTGVIYNNRKECIRIMGTMRYRRALANKEFDFNYILGENEKPINTVFS